MDVAGTVSCDRCQRADKPVATGGTAKDADHLAATGFIGGANGGLTRTILTRRACAAGATHETAFSASRVSRGP